MHDHTAENAFSTPALTNLEPRPFSPGENPGHEERVADARLSALEYPTGVIQTLSSQSRGRLGMIRYQLNQVGDPDQLRKTRPADDARFAPHRPEERLNFLRRRANLADE